jgi:hypothetical protein
MKIETTTMRYHHNMRHPPYMGPELVVIFHFIFPPPLWKSAFILTPRNKQRMTYITVVSFFSGVKHLLVVIGLNNYIA